MNGNETQGPNEENSIQYKRKLCKRLIDLCGDSRFHRNAALRRYYKENGSLIWIGDNLNFSKADSLLSWLQYTEADGINPRIFHLKRIRKLMKKLQESGSAEYQKHIESLAKLDFWLSVDYLRYVDGMKFGFVNPESVYNNLEYLPSIADSKIPSNKRRMLYDMKIYHPSITFDMQALRSVSFGLNAFIRSCQPGLTEYQVLKSKLPVAEGSYRRKMILNMERYRWKPYLRRGVKYVWINLAESKLYGIDRSTGNNIHMKVCQGAVEHKTPILSSRIKYVEINPFWIIPKSIVRREVIPGMQRDYHYLEDRGIKVLNRKGKEVDSHSVRWNAASEDIPYTFRQENGGENSLGRLIFRFKNNFSIFLHDTNSREAFAAKDRAVSHGCVRLEHPLDLVWFLMWNKNETELNKIKKETLKEKVKYSDTYTFAPPVPLFICYFTLYVDDKGKIKECQDPYGYDIPLKNAMDQL